MPRNVRNFWIEAEVDGRKTPIAFGPRGKDGGFTLTVFMRNEGEVEKVVEIEGSLVEGIEGSLVEGIEGTAVEKDSLVLWIECEADGADIILERTQ